MLWKFYYLIQRYLIHTHFTFDKIFKFHMHERRQCLQNTHCRSDKFRNRISLDSSSRNAQQARISHSLSDCAVQAHFVDDFASVMKRTERNASPYENDVRSYPPIEDDLCRFSRQMHPRCTFIPRLGSSPAAKSDR